MRNAYCTFSNAVSKNAKHSLALAVMLCGWANLSLVGVACAQGESISAVSGTATSAKSTSERPSASESPSSSASPIGSPGAPSSPAANVADATLLKIEEAQKNAAKSYQIGDRINLLVEIKVADLENGEHLNLNVPEGASKLEDQGWYIDPSSQFMGGIFRFVVSPIQTGSLTLPTLLISKDDKSVIGRTAPYTIQVTGPDEKNVKEAELLDITSNSLAAKYWILFSLITLALAGLIAYLIYKFIKTRKKKPRTLPKTPTEPDHVIALRKITDIYHQYPFTLNNLKPVAFGISETLKEFFSRRFKIDATEATTDEMIELLRKEAFSRENLREVQLLFQDLDLLKFTKVEAYSNFEEKQFQDLKIRSQTIVQKWKLTVVIPEEPKV